MPTQLPPADAVQQPDHDVQQLMLVLRNSLWPSHREWAAEQLSKLDWHAQPMIAEALMYAAQQDPAATVRAACVRNLGKMNVNTPNVVAALQAMKGKEDPVVAMEIDTVLVRFLSQQVKGGVQQVSVTKPAETEVKPAVEQQPAPTPVENTIVAPAQQHIVIPHITPAN